MTRRHFQMIVVVWQFLMVGYFAVDYATEHTLPVELTGEPSAYASVLDPDRFAMMEIAFEAAFWTQIFIGLVASTSNYVMRDTYWVTKNSN